MKLDLYRIDKEYELLFNLIEELGFNDEMELRLNDALHEFDITALNVGAHYKNLSIKIDLMRQYEKDMAAKRKALEVQVQKFEDFIKSNMVRFGVNKVEGPEIALRVSRVKPKVRVLTDDLSKVADCHKRIKVIEEVDKEAIRHDLENGIDVPYARLDESYSLTIK